MPDIHSHSTALDRLAELARLVFESDAAIVDLKSIAGCAARGEAELPEDSAERKGLADPSTALAHGFLGQASVPIRLGEERIGTFAVLNRTGRAFDTRDVEILRRLAELVAEGFVLRRGDASRVN